VGGGIQKENSIEEKKDEWGKKKEESDGRGSD